MSAQNPTSLEQARRDRRARERFVEAHLPAVRAVAARYGGLNVPYDDLVQEGCIGLLDAIETFDSTRGVDFETFSRFQIRCAIRDALTHASRLIRLPKQVVERRRAIDRAEAELAAGGGHVPSSVEIAGALGLPPAVVVEARDAPGAWTPLEAPLEQLLADAAAIDPARDAARHEEVEELRRALDSLPERHHEIVVRRFGIGCPREDLSEVATSLHVSRQRARAIEQAALSALRDRLDPPRPNEGERSCHQASSSPTEASTARRRRSQTRSQRRSAPTASRLTRSRR